MAIIRQGILGGVQNKIGNVVGTSWKGIPVLKSLPLSVANPRTAGQVFQRNRFTNVVAFAVSILAEVIKPLWDRFAQQQSGYNAFISENISNFNDAGLVTPAQLVISKGKMSATQIDNISSDVRTSTVTIEWNNDTGQGFKQASDTAFVVISNTNGRDVTGYDTGAVRTDQLVQVSKELTAGVTYAVWLAFRRADGTIVSDTSYSTFTA